MYRTITHLFAQKSRIKTKRHHKTAVQERTESRMSHCQRAQSNHKQESKLKNKQKVTMMIGVKLNQNL